MSPRLAIFSSFLFIACGTTDPMGTDKEDEDPTDTTTDDMTDDTTSCSGEMFDKYGLDAFLAVNDAIIAKAVAAPTSEVGTSFQALASSGEERVAEFRTNLGNFLVMVYGGPNNYDGPDMVTAHAGLGITSDQYDWFVANVVVPALSETGVSDDDIANCFAPPVVDPALKSAIVEGDE